MIGNKEKGILLLLISCFFGAITITLITLGGNVPVYEKSFLRNVTTIIVSIIVIKKSGGVFFGHKGSRWILVLRALCGTLAVWSSYWSLSHMMIANSTILTKISPIFTVIFAAIFLKEKIKKIHIISFIIAFIGVILVVKPTGSSYALLPSLAAILSAFLGAGVATCIRTLRKKENPNTIVFFYAFFSMCLSIPLMIIHFQMPTEYQLIVLLSAGISSTVTQFTLTFAYRFAAAKEISVYNYSSIIFVTLLGYVIWGDMPDKLAFLGYAFIIGGALLLWFVSRKETVEEKRI
ncbi:DMT family transporter [Clostridium thermobutyricum]|uniref:DMT family transporter n=1 Tax=Clostridium thermobutyricum TaxID=29372 RepID=UPI00311A3F66